MKYIVIVFFIQGRNTMGQLGQPELKTYEKPTEVPGLEGFDIIDAACRRNHTLFLTDTGLVYACGADFFSDENFNDNEDVEMTESENMDDSIFQKTSQDLVSGTQTFNHLSYHTQLPPCQPFISQAASNHSKLTVVYNLEEAFDQKIPQSIVNLYGEIKGHYSDWTFISIMCGQLCTDKFPMGCYHNLKLALLMSLVTTSESPLHIMAIGSEISSANAIMREMGDLAERFMPVTNKTSDGIEIKKNGTCEAGALVLASRGVSFIGYWQNLKPKIKTQLIREIETNTLLVQKAQKHVALESTVWAHWNQSKKMKKDISSLDQFLK